MAGEQITSEQAVNHLSAVFKDDPECAWAWHCNIACCAMDEGLDHAAANRAAARFMQLAFGVDTSAAPAAPGEKGGDNAT